MTFDVETEANETIPSLEEMLVDLYNRKVTDSWTVHQEGVQAGIRYALIALNQKVEGINA